MGGKGRRFYTFVVIEGYVSVVAIGISILAKNLWHRGFGKAEICKKMRSRPIENSPHATAIPRSPDARPVDSATPLRVNAHIKQ